MEEKKEKDRFAVWVDQDLRLAVRIGAARANQSVGAFVTATLRKVLVCDEPG